MPSNKASHFWPHLVFVLLILILCSCSINGYGQTELTPVITYTATTRLPSSTATLTPTFPEATPSSTNTVDPLLPRPGLVRRTPSPEAEISLIVKANEEPKIIALDRNLAPVLEMENRKPNLSLSADGCHILQWGAFEMIERDLSGKITQDIELRIGNNKESTGIYDYEPSPDGKWLVYKEVYGTNWMCSCDAEEQDVMLFSLSHPEQQEIRLTSHRGAMAVELTWSPDSKFVAYTDYDDQGFRQIYIYDVANAEKIQLTHLSDKNDKQAWVSRISWSPRSDKLAVAIDSSRSQFSHAFPLVGIISLKSLSVQWMEVKGDATEVGSIIWAKDEKTILIGTRTDPQYLVWYDLETEKQIRRVDYSSFPGRFLYGRAFSIDGVDIIVIIEDNSFLLYDYLQNVYEIVAVDFPGTLFIDYEFLQLSDRPVNISKCPKP